MKSDNAQNRHRLHLMTPKSVVIYKENELDQRIFGWTEEQVIKLITEGLHSDDISQYRLGLRNYLGPDK